MAVADTIREKLQSAFSPETLEVVDDSAKHAGHAGARPQGETHYTVRIVSAAFAGLSRVERQRRVYDVLKAEMAPEGIHALALSTHAPGEGPDAQSGRGSLDPA